MYFQYNGTKNKKIRANRYKNILSEYIMLTFFIFIQQVLYMRKIVLMHNR